MNDKKKRVLALLAAIALLIIAMLPLFFAFRDGENAQGEFLAVVAVAIFVPIFVYLCMLLYKVLQGRKPRTGPGVKNVVLDVGNVLIDYDWETYLKSFELPEEEYRTLSEVIFNSDVWRERDKAEFPEEVYVQRMVDAAPQYEEDIRRVMDRVCETVHQLEYSVTWIEFLKEQGCRVYVLSNYPEAMLAVNQKDMAFLPLLDGAVFSCDVHMAKPDREIYELLLERYHLKAEDSVFIDDRQENCDGASAVGMRTIRFDNFPQAAKELEKLLGQA